MFLYKRVVHSFTYNYITLIKIYHLVSVINVICITTGGYRVGELLLFYIHVQYK